MPAAKFHETPNPSEFFQRFFHVRSELLSNLGLSKTNAKVFPLTLSVSIIEDQSRIRAHLVDLIKADNRCDLVGSASNGADARLLISQNKADVYLVDLGLPDVDGVDLIALIKSSCPTARSLVLSTFGDTKHINRSIRAGAAGYLLKDEAKSNLVDKIVSLHNGESPVSTSLVKSLFQHISGENEKQESNKSFTKFRLTPREIEVMHLLVQGLSIIKMGDKLCISSHTVNQDLRSIYRKLDVHSRAMAVNVAIQNGFLEV